MVQGRFPSANTGFFAVGDVMRKYLYDTNPHAYNLTDTLQRPNPSLV